MNNGEVMHNADAMRMIGVCLFAVSVVQVGPEVPCTPQQTQTWTVDLLYRTCVSFTIDGSEFHRVWYYNTGLRLVVGWYDGCSNRHFRNIVEEAVRINTPIHPSVFTCSQWYFIPSSLLQMGCYAGHSIRYRRHHSVHRRHCHRRAEFRRLSRIRHMLQSWNKENLRKQQCEKQYLAVYVGPHQWEHHSF